MSEIPGGLSLAWEGPLAGVWRIIDRKFRRRPRDRKGLFNSFVCALYVSRDRAEVIRLEMLSSMGYRRCRESAVPARLRLSACATSVPVHRASSIAVPDFAHLYERIRFYAEGPFAYASADKNKKLPVKIPPFEDTVTTASQPDHPNPASASL
jgi:hypothetical protein